MSDILIYIFRVRYFLLIAAFSFEMLACKKFVEVPLPPNQIVSAAVFSDSSDATSAVLGMYVAMSNSYGQFNLCDGGMTVFTGLASDELYPTTGISDDNEFYADAISPVDNGSNEYYLWFFGYQMIYQANACIIGINESSGISTSLKNQLVGESQLIRAFVYFNLVNLYGDIPLVTTTDYKINSVLARSPTDSIYSQIVSDLLSAQSLLSVDYVTEGRVRPNQATATALLAKVYLFEKQWVKAEAAANQIIGSGVYSLDSDLNDVFLAGSNEAIWQLVSSLSGLETSEGYHFVPTDPTVVPPYIIDSSLLTAFEKNDERKVKWLDSSLVNGQAYYYPYKYKLGLDGNSSPLEDYMIFRLSEQYLIRAEARAEQGGDLSGAISDLNLIRARAGLSNIVASTQTAVLDAILKERRVELFCEWGNRWFDLKRLGVINAVLGAPGLEKRTWINSAALFPIPLSQLHADPFLIQNPGY